MNKEKFQSLVTYQQDIKNRLASEIPTKHAHRIEEYKSFLVRELKKVTDKIESAKMEGVK